MRKVKATHQSMNVIHGETRPRIPLRDLSLERGAVFVDTINSNDLLQHPARDFRQVTTDAFTLVGPVLVRTYAALTREAVFRGEVQRRSVHNDEVPPAVVVDALELVVDAVEVGGDVSAGDLLVLDQGVVAEVVGPDPDGVDGLVDGVLHELRAVGEDVGRIREVGGDFVALDVWEGSIDGAEPSRGDIVGADRTADSVVVDVGAAVLGDVLWPGPSTICSVVVGRVCIANRRCVTVVVNEVSQP